MQRGVSTITDSRQCTCKVGSVLEKYDITEYDDRLVEHWTGEGERYSVRTLADEFNKRILEAVLEDARMQTLSGEVENLYRLLTEDDVTSGMRTQTRDQLEQHSVSVDEVESDFISHQTIYRHLTGCRGVERTEPETGSEQDSVGKGAHTIQSLRGKTMAVTENTIDRLVSSDDLAIQDFDVYVDITVVCNDCGLQVSIDDLLDHGGCRCMDDK